MSTSATSLTPDQIRRRATDYDSQIRQGLEDGDVRQVVKRLGANLVQLLTLRTKGSQEQVAAFPKSLFLYRFVRAWNSSHTDPNFIEDQVQELQRFDATPTPALPSNPLATTVQPAPRPKPITPPNRPQPPARVVKAPAASPSPPPAVPIRRPPPPPTEPHRVAPPRMERGESGGKRRVVEVEMPARSTIQKFRELDQDEGAESGGELQEVEIFKRACERCQRGKRDCLVDEVGSACIGCKTRKYGCSHTGQTDLKTMVVTRPITDSESDVLIVEDRKGKKRKAESPVPTKRKAVVKQEKVEKTRKPKGKVEKPKEEARPKASGSKPTARRRVAPKSLPVVESSEEEPVAMDVDNDEREGREPKPKRARATKDVAQEHSKRLAVLEERMKAFDRVAEETTRTSMRVDAIENTVTRFAGSLDAFLGRIQIDDRLRLVPDHMRLTPGPLPSTTRSASPTSPLILPMDEDEDFGGASSSVADTRTTPSDVVTDTRMADAIRPESSQAPTPTVIAQSAPLQAPVAVSAAAQLPGFNVIPATPQGSQDVAATSLALPVATPMAPPAPIIPVEQAVLPAPQHTRSRSRTPAKDLLEVGGRTTRARSRSKTPL